MKITRVSRHWHLLVWLLWALFLVDSFLLAAPGFVGSSQTPDGWPCTPTQPTQSDLPLLAGVVALESEPDRQRRLFPWWPRGRWRKLALRHYRAAQEALARTLEALAPHALEIWLDAVDQALLRLDVDLRFLFYDLTAFVVHGEYRDSELADFGFAHNTPSGKRKLKVGLSASRDGGLPLEYAPWSGRTADVATVQDNLERLGRLLARQGFPMGEVLLIGDRAKQLRALRQSLAEVRAKIGQPYYRTAAQVQRHAQARLANSPVGKLVRVWATESCGQVQLHWKLDRAALLATMRHDGRYLLVTNDPGLTPTEMLARYREKDRIEKRFEVSKQDLRVCPIYLHQDRRIQGMLLLNMLDLLAYSVLERQMGQHGLGLTTRRLIARLLTSPSLVVPSA